MSTDQSFPVHQPFIHSFTSTSSKNTRTATKNPCAHPQGGSTRRKNTQIFIVWHRIIKSAKEKIKTKCWSGLGREVPSDLGASEGTSYAPWKKPETFRPGLQIWPLLSYLGNMKKDTLGSRTSMNKSMRWDISGCTLEITSIQFAVIQKHLRERGKKRLGVRMGILST